MILTDDEMKVLLVPHFVNGQVSYWYPPGGGVEFLESIESAATREFGEETGLKVALTENLGYVQFHREIEPWHSITFVFRGKYLSGTLQAERTKYGDKMPEWFPIDELPEKIVPYLKETVKSALKNLTNSSSGPAKAGSLS